MGVPEPQIRMKMSAEGVDPDIILDPERMLPAEPAAEEEDSDADSDSS